MRKVTWVNAKMHDLDEVTTATLAPYQNEDERDAEIADLRLKQIEAHPDSLISGTELDEALDEILA
jgi:hypothetical protein